MRLMGPRPAAEQARVENAITKELHDIDRMTPDQRRFYLDGWLDGEFVILTVRQSDSFRDVLNMFRIVLFNWFQLKASDRTSKRLTA